MHKKRAVAVLAISLIFFSGCKYFSPDSIEKTDTHKLLTQEEAMTIVEQKCLKNGEKISLLNYNNHTQKWVFSIEFEEGRSSYSSICRVSALTGEHQRLANINFLDKTISDAEVIKRLFIEKYPNYARTMVVKIEKQDEVSARGSITMQAGQAGGIFLANKDGYWPGKYNGEWKIIFDGNGPIPCDLKDQYGVAEDMMADCVYTGYVPPVILSGEPVSTFKIFFATKNKKGEFDCDTFNYVIRIVPKTTAVAKTALELLFAGPTAEEKDLGYHIFWITKELSTNLKRVFIKGNIAYLDWSENIVGDIGNASSSCGQNTFFSPIYLTLIQFPEIKNVVHAINGQPKTFYDWMQIGCPDETKIKTGDFNYCDSTPYIN